jgi:signal transduction histidine kinase
MSINFDYYSISLLIGGFTALLSGFVVFIHNRHNLENIAWLLSNITSAIWSFGYFATITASTHVMAYYSDWVLHSAAVFIPVFYLLSVLSITGEYQKHRIQLIITGLIGFVFLVMVPTKTFILDVIPKAHFNFVPDAGPAYIYFFLFFFATVIYTLYFVFKKLRAEKDPIQRAKLKYIIIFTIFGFGGGGSVFFLTFNLPILPYPIILFSIYPAVSGYAIFRYQLFDVKVITTELLVFILWIILLIRTLLSTNLYDALVNGAFLLFLIIVGVLLIRSVIKEVKLREQIEKLASDLKEANTGQASLMHFMNHQVKGRFGNARNIFAELLTDDYGVMPDTAKPLLQKGLDETKMGVDYVQNILKGASAENGTLPYNMVPIDFKPVVEDAFNKQKEYAEKKSLEFKLHIEDGNYNITGDNVELGESIRNLLDNSINYTEKGSINVTLKNTGSNIRLEIKDTGVGLSDDDKTKLFKSGGRGSESIKINVNSTGFGLVFVKGVIEAHKGRVWAESEGRGKGSTFIIELPK